MRIPRAIHLSITIVTLFPGAMFWLSLNNLAVSRENTRRARTAILTRVYVIDRHV